MLFNRILLLSLALAAGLSACSGASDPASEAPVALKAGKYRVEISGQAQTAFMGTQQTQANDRGSVCLSSDDDGVKVSKLARGSYSMHEGCSHSANDRVGNSVSGRVSCPTDPERMPGGEIAIEYTGTLAADMITLEGKQKMDLPTANLTEEEKQLLSRSDEVFDKVSIIVKAERIGDC